MLGPAHAELLCYTDDTVVECIQEWPATYGKYHEREIGIIKESAYALKRLRHRTLPELQLTFRTTSILPLSQERNIKDPMAIHLFYIQAVFNVIESNYPCEPDVAGKHASHCMAENLALTRVRLSLFAAGLAGLQMQLTLGDHKPETHTLEYLGRFGKSYVPQHLKRKMRSTKWKTRIIEEHKRHTGKDKLILQLLYLQLVRQWPYYGSTFYKAEYLPATQSFYKQPFEGEVRIGTSPLPDGVFLSLTPLVPFEHLELTRGGASHNIRHQHVWPAHHRSEEDDHEHVHLYRLEGVGVG
jgi:hypothetical protein